MQPSRAPWWFYILALSFVGYFALILYSFFWGPEFLNIVPDYSTGGMVVQRVLPNGAGDRAGLHVGDRIVAVDRVPFPPGRGRVGWFIATANFETGRPIPLEVERDGEPIELTLNNKHASPRDLLTSVYFIFATQGLWLVLAFVIGFRRPHDSVGRITAWNLASIAIALIFLGHGWASIWRRLPTPLGFLLWPADVSLGLIPGISLACAAVFPRKLFRTRWPWIFIWTPVVLLAALGCILNLQLVYRPKEPVLWEGTPLYSDFLWRVPFLLIYAPACLLVWFLQYRRLTDANEKRRLRIFFAGSLVSLLAGSANIILFAFLPASVQGVIVLSPVPLILSLLGCLGALAYAYAVLKHRVFDLGVIVRRGLQYALARGALVSAVPTLAAVFIADLLLHGNQPILAVFRARGWIYVALAALAAVAFMKRRDWLEALDRRFFREQYDARRILCEVVEEVRVARSFEQEAPQVTARIETALHPEFVALLVCEPQEKFYRTLAASPAGTGPTQLQRESKFVALVRLLGKPVEVSQTGANWLQQQLPHEETDYLRRGRIDLVVPIATDPERKEVLLVLGVKRSEEPYSGEDRDLLVAIATSLAILLERPATAAATPPNDVFEECPQCGSCYDSGSSQCTKEGARLLPVILPRLLDGRYRLERRLGRGGMGTVYAASDALLERVVAVKVIREDLVGSAEAAERFRREARAAASFAHPNVVTVHDFGVVSGTRAFLVMEMLEGRTLREKLRVQKHLPIEHLLSISRHICAALSAAHRRHLVHRDLKPENIFLVAPESSETAKILDFGIAKFVPNYAEARTAETATGAILGTPRYMSPEQRGGQSVHHSWDLWALAVMTYEMLTGFYPFEDGSYDWLAPGSSVPFTPVNRYMPTAPKSWQALFEHSFARELSCRHESVESFLSELQVASS